MTRVAILWHMHQPFYQDVLTSEHVLPWVRMHALKDYWGMAALLRDHPSVKVTFNLVPSLLVQLEAFAHDTAQDRHLELGLKRAEDLTAEECAFCVAEFFHAHITRMIDPHPRYRELLALRADGEHASLSTRVSRFSAQDIRDLQIWHKLVWIDPAYHDGDPRIRSLVEKGKDFSEEDKGTLRQVELEIVRRVVPEYASAAARGQVELSTSPFYHPILPLLCDSDVYLRTHPHSAMPHEPFRHPEDAAEQLDRAVALHQRTFGYPPQGLWPSEGSVSDAMVPLVRRAGLHWMATDEGVLARTIGTPITRDDSGYVESPEALYRPFQVGTEPASIACAFRDHYLSDLISFSYASWPAHTAADDFVTRLAETGRRYATRTGGEEATVFVILDGENAWESYDGQGRPFLQALYSRLGSHPDLRTMTMSEACQKPTKTLPSIFPGSWINTDFYVWMGHRDDHRAWSQLAEARHTLDAAAAVTEPDALARAREEILIAEGSDWFWWYGDDHSSAHDRQFDDLFRRHVQNVYRALGISVPAELFDSNITTGDAAPVAAPSSRMPCDLIRPTLDGETSSYFEWMGAESVALVTSRGAMHSTDSVRPRQVAFGSDRQQIFIRITGTQPITADFEGGLQVYVNVLTPKTLRILIRLKDSHIVVECEPTDTPTRHETSTDSAISVAAGTTLELAIPFSCLGAKPQTSVTFLVGCQSGDAPTQHATSGRLSVKVPRP